MMRTAFPDFRNPLDRVVGDGDIAVSYGRMVGTHEGELMGLALTGRTLRRRGRPAGRPVVLVVVSRPVRRILSRSPDGARGRPSLSAVGCPTAPAAYPGVRT